MPLILNGSTGVLDGLQVSSANLTSEAVYTLAPAGAVCFVCQSTAPIGWLKANGAAVSRTTYSALFTALGTTFGAGNGSTTFNLPDLRGEFPRGWDDGRGADNGRGFGSSQDGTWTRQLMNDYSDGDNNGDLFFVGQSYAQPDGTTTSIPGGAVTGNGAGFSGAMNDNASRANHTNNVGFPGNWIRYRPRNIALLAIVKF